MLKLAALLTTTAALVGLFGAGAQASAGTTVAPQGIGAAFTLVNRGTAKCVEVFNRQIEDNSPLVQNDCLAGGADFNQNWLAESVGGNQFRLRNLNANQCLDYARAVNGQNAKVHVCGNDLFQRWQLSVAPEAPGFLRLISAGKVGGTNLCLDLLGGNTDNGALIGVWQCGVGNNNQLWRQG
ncbi:RICIN domain-containing protein [Lentzea sp. NPDC059081]|uniref:RICIN domain-containing protein n=1 Tax=Lentzea sp. NPDC059081 TaxID=3346719 RepID=UPI0036C877B4